MKRSSIANNFPLSPVLLLMLMLAWLPVFALGEYQSAVQNAAGDQARVGSNESPLGSGNDSTVTAGRK